MPSNPKALNVLRVRRLGERVNQREVLKVNSLEIGDEAENT